MLLPTANADVGRGSSFRRVMCERYCSDPFAIRARLNEREEYGKKSASVDRAIIVDKFSSCRFRDLYLVLGNGPLALGAGPKRATQYRGHHGRY